ncbi:alpha-ketoacid dehydrogenase subunit beta [Mycolicibacterium sp.]|uniref:alpha-ketoacid dehydrogenase subunit beta n=1 Tax=Mycolicibacterium sp. TaxID=2320850 RepID=UPI003D0D33B2
MSTPTAVRGLTYTQAIADAIRAEMAVDDNVVLLGEDVGRYGGIYGHMSGLYEQFSGRVRDTPISEAGFIGAAAGAATRGVRPIVELMTVDFFGVAMDQIYNYLAKVRYVSNGSRGVPMVIMASVGNPLRQGVTHSQTLHGTFAHLPGLKVVTPATPGDVEALMRAAIRDDDPVLFLFHRALLSISDVPWDVTAPGAAGIGRAAVRRPGTDITIVAVSFMVHQAMEAAESLAAEDIDAEVLDLRGLVPLDGAALEESVRRTGRLLVLDEDYRSFGMSAEIMAVAIERAADALRTPPRRLARVDVPIPFSRPLEDAVMLSPTKIADAARAVVQARPRPMTEEIR